MIVDCDLKCVLSTPDGDFTIRPVHTPGLCRKESRQGRNLGCPGCMYDVLAEELLSLYRPSLTTIDDDGRASADDN